jgi:hypothetical protein
VRPPANPAAAQRVRRSRSAPTLSNCPAAAALPRALLRLPEGSFRVTSLLLGNFVDPACGRGTCGRASAAVAIEPGGT